MDKVRVGFIGCGQIADLHAAGYRDNPSGTLHSVADVDPARAESFARAWGAKRWHTDYRRLLEDPDVDAVEILLPHHLHLRVTLDALAARKHVSLQKPMALSTDEADLMIEAAKRSGKTFRVFENFRCYAPYRRAGKLIAAGDIGELLSIRVKSIRGRGVGGWAQTPEAVEWRNDPRRGGGPPAIFDHGYHIASIVVYFMGRVERVHAMADTALAGTLGYTGAPAMITWKHEGGHRYGSWEIVHAPDVLVRTRFYPEDEWLEVTGTRGVVWVTRCSGDLLGAPPVILYRDGQTTNYSDMETGWASSFICGAHEFTGAIAAGRQPELDAGEAAHVLAFGLAAMRSALERREVTL